MRKIITNKEMRKVVKSLKLKGKKIVFCNGCFDIIHLGHIKFLEEAKKQGDVLIVGLNSDASVRQNKGRLRPINSEKTRAEVLAALSCVDFLTIFSDKTPLRLIKTIKPNVFVNGEEYGKNCMEAPLVKKFGGRVHLIKKFGGLSTTKIIDKISRLN